MIYVDFETRGFKELGGMKSVGAYNYVQDPRTEPLMLSWAIDNEKEVDVWQMHLGPMPSRLRERLEDPREEIVAFNSTFERLVFNTKFNLDLPVSRFQDPQPSARYLSLPGDLEEVSLILGLPNHTAKDKEGKRLIELFSKPHKKKNKETKEVTWFFNDWNSHPEDWAKFVEYCRQDTIAEREVLRREKLLEVWPLPPRERKIWEFDQKVNDRGIPINLDFVTCGLELANREKKERIEENNKLTGSENSNSTSQLVEWAKTQGYNGRNPDEPEKFSLNKDVVAIELKNNSRLTPLCREVLINRQAAASTSYRKLAAILRQVSPDNRIRGQFIYMGSSRCGRWSGSGLQPHNMARPIELFEDEIYINEARELILARAYEEVRARFVDPRTQKPLGVLQVVKSNIRTALEAAEGNRLNVNDLNAIETRVGAWVAGCQPLLDVFAQGRDTYLDFAVKMSQIAYEILARDIKSKDPKIKAAAKKWRQIAKPGVLGCIYRMGAVALQAYAEKMGTILSLDECETIVRVFRESYKEIVQAWFDLEHKIEEVMKGFNTVRYFGPNNCIKIDKFTFQQGDNLRTILRIHLPSGRRLHYVDASWEKTKMPWKDKNTGEDVYRETLVYATQDQDTGQWVFTTSHGGKVFENIVQGVARDVLADKLLEFEENGLPVVLHVHDEGVTETPDDLLSPGVREMEHIMSAPVSWAPTLPLGSDGFESVYYHK